MDRGFENINFGSGPAHERAVIVHRSRMLLVGAGTTRQPLAGKIRKVPQVVLVAGEEGHVRNPVQRLIGNGSDITCVIGVRPLQAVNQAWTDSTGVDRETHHSLQGGTIPGPAEVAHRPDSGPQSSNPVQTRQCHRDFNISSREAELVPTANHPAFVIQIMSFLLRQCDPQGPVLGSYSERVIPLEVTRLPVVQVDGFPVWIVSGVESPSVIVKFIREDQL